MQPKTIVVTGASTGIGYAIAKLFIERGHHIVMNSLNKENLVKAYASLGSPSNAVVFAGDISEKNTSNALIAEAVKHFGKVDVLINNAGIFSPKPFLDVEESDIDKYIKTNLKGTFYTSQAAVTNMLSNGGGSIINIGTVLVDHAIAGFPASAPVSSKGAIHALTRQLAAEFGKNNIKVNTIAPGIIRSPLQGKIGIDNADALAGLHLLGKIGEGNDIAEAAYMLANNNFITGEVLNVDGGHVAGHLFA